MSSTLGASLLRTVLSDGTLKILGSGLDKGPIIQGSQFTSKEFTEFCESMGITQSMSKAGYPYDNAPMERYFNTLKNELIYLHDYPSEDDLYASVDEFAYIWYNHVRPHSYNGYKTPFEARTGISNY